MAVPLLLLNNNKGGHDPGGCIWFLLWMIGICLVGLMGVTGYGIYMALRAAP